MVTVSKNAHRVALRDSTRVGYVVEDEQHIPPLPAPKIAARLAMSKDRPSIPAFSNRALCEGE